MEYKHISFSVYKIKYLIAYIKTALLDKAQLRDRTGEKENWEKFFLGKQAYGMKKWIINKFLPIFRIKTRQDNKKNTRWLNSYELIKK